jgi:hypothetical protein
MTVKPDTVRIRGTQPDKIQNMRCPDQRLFASTDIWRTGTVLMQPGMESSQVIGYSDGRVQTVCKTVGSAYVGSNPTPATNVMSQDIEDTVNLH